MALLGALCVALNSLGFINRSLRAQVSQLLGVGDREYTVNQMSYDLARLRRKGFAAHWPPSINTSTTESTRPVSTQPENSRQTPSSENVASLGEEIARRIAITFTSEDSRITSGVWEAEPGLSRWEFLERGEPIYVLEGRMDEGGIAKQRWSVSDTAARYLAASSTDHDLVPASAGTRSWHCGPGSESCMAVLLLFGRRVAYWGHDSDMARILECAAAGRHCAACGRAAPVAPRRARGPA